MSKPPVPRAKTPSRASIPDAPPKPAEGRRSSPDLPPPGSLDEVERALSILHGRHPDAVRAERETNVALATRKAEAEARAKRAGVEEKRRYVVTVVAGCVLFAAAAFGFTQYSRKAARAKAVEDALRPGLAPYLARGFTRWTPSRFATERLEVDSADPTCFIALGSRSPGEGAIRVERPSGALEGSGSIAWCACGAEHTVARLTGTGPEAGGIAVLSIAAPEVGGDHGLVFLEPLPDSVATPDECSQPSLDAWIDRSAKVRAKDDALDEETRSGLAHAGFAVAASLDPGLPFVVVPGATDACALVVGTAPDDLLSLRLPGGERPIADAKGPLGFCESHARSVTVWRKGAGRVVVERVPAAHGGGLHGLAEIGARLGLPAIGAAWVSEGDLAWDATSTLRASGIAPPEISVSTDGRAVTHARLLALSLEGAMVRADAPDSSGYACEPPLTKSSRTAVCVQSAALAWRVVGSVGKAGIAAATLPFWMQAFSGTTDPAALGAQLALVKLGRRLLTEGFEATTLDGVTEIEGGAVVIGRSGDDAIVAVQLTREAPWAAPCSTGDAWNLEGDPAVVSLAPGAQVKLACAPRSVGARDRRTVVFRHAAASAPGE